MSRTLYLAAPTDEVALTARALPHLAAMNGAIPEASFFRDLAAAEGMDVATMALYQAIRRHDADFIAGIDALPVAAETSDAGTTVVVVPALFYTEFPDVGGGGELAMEIGARLGFDMRRVPTVSMGSLAANVEIVREFIAALPDRPLWFLSLSRGTGEVRLLFDRHAGDAALERVRGWINVCGIVGGTPIHDLKAATASGRLKYRAIVTFLGGKYSDFAEYDTQHPHWQRPLRIPPAVRIVNAVALPLPSHVQTHLVGRYRSLAPYGPNDGMVASREALLPGSTYPMWGLDHFFRGPQVSPFLYRLFRWIRESQR